MCIFISCLPHTFVSCCFFISDVWVLFFFSKHLDHILESRWPVLIHRKYSHWQTPEPQFGHRQKFSGSKPWFPSTYSHKPCGEETHCHWQRPSVDRPESSCDLLCFFSDELGSRICQVVLYRRSSVRVYFVDVECCISFLVCVHVQKNKKAKIKKNR